MRLVDIAEKFFGIEYVWAGNDPTTGMDCSGFVCECLRSLGYIGKKDYTAQMLHDIYVKKRAFNMGDSLYFFGGDAEHITHVAIRHRVSTNGSRLMIEAGGEGRVNTDKGYVRIRPVNSRRDLVATLNVGKL